MRPSLRSSRVPQLSLFHPPSPSPRGRPSRARSESRPCGLLARLLREHRDGVVAASRGPGGAR